MYSFSYYQSQEQWEEKNESEVGNTGLFIDAVQMIFENVGATDIFENSIL